MKTGFFQGGIRSGDKGDKKLIDKGDSGYFDRFYNTSHPCLSPFMWYCCKPHWTSKAMNPGKVLGDEKGLI